MEHYPSVVQLDACPDIYSVKQVVATEKLHGSNFRIGFPLGMKTLDELRFGSRDIEYKPGEDFPLGSTLNMIKKQRDLLQRMFEVFQSYGFNEVTVFGEAHGPGIKAKGVKYGTGQDPMYRAFDIMVGPNFVTYDLFVEISNKCGLPIVPEVWRGEPSKENFDALLEQPSVVGKLNGLGDDNIAEGVVLRSNPLLRDVFGEWLICKHKCARFAEKASEPKEKVARGPSPIDDLIVTVVTRGRVLNAIGRLRDRGSELTTTMKDMPLLLSALCADIAKDCQSELTELGANEGSIKGNVSRILGPLYREMLAANEV